MSQLNISYSEREIICDGLAALVGICRAHSKSFQNVKFLVLYVKVNCVPDFDEGSFTPYKDRGMEVLIVGFSGAAPSVIPLSMRHITLAVREGQVLQTLFL